MNKDEVYIDLDFGEVVYVKAGCVDLEAREECSSISKRLTDLENALGDLENGTY